MQFTKYIRGTLPSEVALRLHPLFKQAAKLSSNNEEEAYLFGVIIKKAKQENRIDDYTEELVRKAAERHTAFSFYALKNKPHFDNWYELAVFSAFFGLLGIIIGVRSVFSEFGDFIVSGSPNYLKPHITGGGYWIILGLVMFIGGTSKTIQERKRKRLLASFQCNGG
jgi:hypothetical protein